MRDEQEQQREAEETIPAVAQTSTPDCGESVIIGVEAFASYWDTHKTTSSSATREREVQRELTSQEVNVDRTDDYLFEQISSEQLPTGIQYTPDFDPSWVFTAGSSDGGRQDDTPVQGLEIGVVARKGNLEETVLTVLNAVAQYYDETGQYPRHKIIKSVDDFVPTGQDGAGLVAVFQPAPDRYSGLMKHMNAVQMDTADAVDSNITTAARLVQYLGFHLKYANLSDWPPSTDVSEAIGWESGQQVGTLPIVERYAPLGAGEIYDPALEDLDLSSDGVPTVAAADISPTMLDIEGNASLFSKSFR